MMSIAQKLTTIAENEQKVYEAGKQSAYDEFWDSYQDNGKRKSYNYAFQSLCWNDENYNPKYPIVASSATNIFVSNPNITDTKVPIDLRGANINNTFAWSGLVTIQEIIIDETTTQPSTPNGFSGLSKLKNIKVTGIWAAGDWILSQSKLLTAESIKSIINALKNYKGTNEEGVYTITLSDTSWEIIEATTPPEGYETWKDYVSSGLGWNV